MKAIDLVIVEDDPMVIQVNRQFVEATGGFRIVGTARTGPEALEVIRAARPDLVLLDIYLPDMDGVATLKEIRRSNLPADVILVTAAQDAETIQDVLRYGAVDYIIKPFKFERLKGALGAYRRMRERLAGSGTLSQEQVDQMIARKGSGGPGQSEVARDLPKGLNDLTMRQVMLCLVRTGEALTACDVAGRVGLSRVTARRYLDHLVKQDQARRLVQYGSVGRPLNRYQAVD